MSNPPRRGSGSPFRPKYPPPGKSYAEARADGTLCESPTWWIKYYVHGKPVRENTKTEKEGAARKILNERLGRVATGQPILPRVDRITYETAAQDLRDYYQTTGSREVEEADWRLAHLERFFRGWRIVNIGPDTAMRYARHRQEEKAANGTLTGSSRSSGACLPSPTSTTSCSLSRS